MGGSDASELLAADGQISLPTENKGSSTTFEFIRPPVAHSASYLGGRPAKTKAKYSKQRSGWTSRIRDAELLGGSPARMGRKPQRSRATDRTARPVEPLVVEGVVEGEPTSSGIGAEQLLAELLSRRQLGAEECEERDAELAETIYSQ